MASPLPDHGDPLHIPPANEGADNRSGTYTADEWVRQSGWDGDIPASSPPRVHVPVDIVVYPICLLVVLLVHGPSEQTCLIIWVLELVGLGLGFLASLRLRLAAAQHGLSVRECGENGRDLRDCLV